MPKYNTQLKQPTGLSTHELKNVTSCVFGEAVDKSIGFFNVKLYGRI